MHSVFTRQARPFALFVLAIVACAGAPMAHAQTPVTPRESAFGVGRSEFMIGGWNYPFIGSLLDTSRARDTMLRYVIYGMGAPDAAAFGREAKFYLTRDSVPYKVWPCKFLHLDGGTWRENPHVASVDEWDQPSTEQVYDSPDSLTVIADSIVMGWTPEAVNWWSKYQDGGLWRWYPPYTQQRRSDGGNLFWLTTSGNQTVSPLTIAVRGHLFEAGPHAEAGAPLFEIDVFYDIGAEDVYALPDSGTQTTTANRSELCTTFVVQREDLMPTALRSQYDLYQEASFVYDPATCNQSVAGPTADSAESKRLNLRVRYMGNEKVALRSIAIRDARADSVLSFNPPFRQLVRDAVDAWRNIGGVEGQRLRRSIISFTGGVEQHPLQAACLDSVNRWIRGQLEDVPDSANGGEADTVSAWVEGSGDRALHQSARVNQVMPELGHWTGLYDAWLGKVVHGPVRQPALGEHNGGRFGIPALDVGNADSLASFERMFQLLSLKQHFLEYPGNFPEQLVMQLGQSAIAARDYRRRLFAVPFFSSRLIVHPTDTSGVPIVDSVQMGRLLEQNEVWAMVGMSLAYGATGVFWQTLADPTNIMDSVAGGWHGDYRDFGSPGGFFVGDTLDWYPELRFQSPSPFNGSYWQAVHRATIDSVYVGWKQRRQTLRDIHRWLGRVGPELVNLRWRDGYSIHACVPIPYFYSYVGYRTQEGNGWAYHFVDVYDTLPARALPDSEIVAEVRSHRVNPAFSAPDPPAGTFVELGLFNRINATNDPMNDTNYVVVCNRRTFGRPADIDSASDRGRLMDSLAGTRRISVRFNLAHPVESRAGYRQWAFIRVQEVEPETSALPGTHAARRTLDSVIHADSAAMVTLAPGRSTLLRITYAPYDESIVSGVLARNGQRKMLWSPREQRYHSVYHRRTGDSSDSRVYYRRSQVLPASSGSILWEPVEYDLGGALVQPQDTYRLHNAYPSMTMRQWGDSAVLSVVWTCHRSTAVGSGDREVVRRNVLSDTVRTAPEFAAIEHIGRHVGVDSSMWGTPVIARIDTGEIMVWSDEQGGLKARSRIMRPMSDSTWWRAVDPAAYSSVLTVPNTTPQSGQRLAGRFPSVPVSASQFGIDNHVGLVWQRSIDTAGAVWQIRYARLRAANKNSPVHSNALAVSTQGAELHPAIDLFQDTVGSVFEAVAWESPSSYWDTTLGQQIYVNAVNFQPLLTSITQQNGQDVLGATSFPYSRAWVESASTGTWQWHAYPSIASLHAAPLPVSGPGSGYYSRDAYEGVYAMAWQEAWPMFGSAVPPLYSLRCSYDFSSGSHDRYAYDGLNPSVSASLKAHDERAAVVYQSLREPTNATDLLRTSRQFFARPNRPVGYLAEGRVLRLRTGDTVSAGAILLRIHDAWISGPDDARALAMVGTVGAAANSLSSAVALLGTEAFDAHDSVRLGVEIAGHHVGDSGAFGSARIEVHVELIDTATGGVIVVLDSFALSGPSDACHRRVDRDLDLLSGHYMIRLRVDTSGYRPMSVEHDGAYPIEKVVAWVSDSGALGKLRRVAVTTTGPARLSAQPNPAHDRMEIRFSVTASDEATIRLYDEHGRLVDEPLARRRVEGGRYALDLSTAQRPSGRYLLELRTSRERVVESMVIVR